MGWQAYKTRRIVYKTAGDDYLPIPPPIPPFLNSRDQEPAKTLDRGSYKPLKIITEQYGSVFDPDASTKMNSFVNSNENFPILVTEPLTTYRDFDGVTETTRTMVTLPSSSMSSPSPLLVTPGRLHSIYDFDSQSKISQLIKDAQDLLVRSNIHRYNVLFRENCISISYYTQIENEKLVSFCGYELKIFLYESVFIYSG